jgi:hypothetical protein
MTVQAESVLGIPEPRCYPMQMARFGLNPFHEPMWRIVFAPSAYKLVGGRWPDGVAEYRICPKYRDLGEVWILEKWISAFEDSGMTATSYQWMLADSDTGLCPGGPYPHRGVYHHVHTFEAVAPGDCNLDWLVGIIAKAKNNDPAQVKQAIEDHYAAKERARHKTGIDKIADARPAFGMRPASLPGAGVHTTKKFRFDLTANDLKGVPRNGARVRPRKGE